MKQKLIMLLMKIELIENKKGQEKKKSLEE